MMVFIMQLKLIAQEGMNTQKKILTFLKVKESVKFVIKYS